MRRSQLVPPAFALAALLFSACSDALPPVTAPVEPEGAELRGPPFRDAGIRRDDTHFTARIRVSRGTESAFQLTVAPSGGGPAASAALRSAAPDAALALDGSSDETMQVEGGYGEGGEIRFGVYWDALTPGAPIGGLRAIGDRVDILDALGRILSSRPFDARMAEAGLPGGTLVGAFFPAGEPGLVTCPPGELACGPMAELRAADATDGSPVGTVREVRRTQRPTAGRVAQLGSDDHSEIVRRYRKLADGAWRLEEVRHTDHVATPQGPRITHSVMAVTYGAWYRDAARDSARASAPRPVVAPAGSAVRPVASSPALTAAPATDAQIIEQLCARGRTNVDILRSKDTTGLSVVYQHGFCADASVWDGFRPRLAAAFPVTRERAFSLASTERVDSQVSELAARLRAGGTRANLMVGHSLGGLLSRRLGQVDSSLVSGVITIGSPQLGSLLADVGAEAAEELLARAIGYLCVGEWLCESIVYILAEGDAGRLLYGVPGLVPPVVEDLRTGSDFVQALNSAPEPFPRAGIEVDVGNRWALFGLIGDARSPRTGVVTGQRPYGHYWVDRAELVYDTARFLQVLSFFLRFEISPYGGGVNCSQSGYSAYWSPCADTDWGSGWYSPWMQDVLAFFVYQLSTMVVVSMDYIDLTWDWLTTRGVDRTDGLIALRSQRYPAAPGRHAPIRVVIAPPGADGHAGQTASPMVVERTIDLVRALGLAGQ